MTGMQFCADCGTRLERRHEEQRERSFCPHCNRILYHSLKVGAGGLIELGGRLLLLQRAIEPFKRYWNLPAGYAEADEDPMHTVVREVREETGLDVLVDGLADVYFFADDPRGNGILIVYACHAVGGELTDTAEGMNAGFFDRESIPANLAGGGHDQAIRAWTQAASSADAT